MTFLFKSSLFELGLEVVLNSNDSNHGLVGDDRIADEETHELLVVARSIEVSRLQNGPQADDVDNLVAEGVQESAQNGIVVIGIGDTLHFGDDSVEMVKKVVEDHAPEGQPVVVVPVKDGANLK